MRIKSGVLENTNQKRYLELDVLRGLAALSVVIYHYTYGYYFNDSKNLSSPPGFLFTYGRMGVQLFFLISGFVIFMTLNNVKSLSEFVISRFSRLYPTYWVCILITLFFYLVLNVPFQQNKYSLFQILINFTMLQQLFRVENLDGAYWTLFVELVFYFWMGLIFKFNQLKSIFWIAIFWIILVLTSILVTLPFAKYIEVLLILKHAPFFTGGIAFYLLTKFRRQYRYHLLAILSLLAALFLLFDNSQGYDLNEGLITISLFVVMYLFVFDKLRFINWKPLFFLGWISYPLYLIHENVGFGIIYWFKKTMDLQIIYIPVTLVLIVLISYLVSRYIENPSRKMIKQSFLKKK